MQLDYFASTAMNNNSKLPILHYSVSNQNLECTKGLLECGYCSVNDLDACGQTALFFCAPNDSEASAEIAQYLINCGIDINAQANIRCYNRTALMTACYYGNKNLIKLLLEYNADFNLLDSNGKAAWEIAQDMLHYSCTEILLNEIVDHGAVTAELEKELQDAVFNNDFANAKSCLERLANKAKFVLNSTQSGTQTFLYRACRYGNANMVELLLDKGAIARPHYYTKYSPLYVACHTGNYDIVKLLLQRYPLLVNTETIENFLPIHAACSQGHLNIVKLIIEHTYSNDVLNIYEATSNNREKEEVIVNKYLFPFDLNKVDVNEQTILYTCVISNKLEICKYLLNIRVKKLNSSEIDKLSKKKQLDFKLRNFLMQYNQHQQDIENTSSGYSFFNYLKGILDTKPASAAVDSPVFSVKYEARDMTESIIEVHTNDDEPVVRFNPINVNYYSKFGVTCLHEAINIGSLELIKLLIDSGADVNLPIYDTTILNSPKLLQQQPPQVTSNCLCEALKAQNKEVFLYLLHLDDAHLFNDDTIKFTIKYCLNLLHTKVSLDDDNQRRFLINMFSYLLTFLKQTPDTEYKIAGGGSSASGKASISRKSSKYFRRIDAGNAVNTISSDCDGLILNWNAFEPQLRYVYESWLLDICKYYRFSSRKLHLISAQLGGTNKLHVETITRIDLSFNGIEEIPLVLFQIESLRILKLNNNKLKEFPLRKSVFDDLTRENVESDVYKCSLLEDLDMSHNELTSVPSQIFHLKGLKYLNVSDNKLETLSFDLWHAITLLELNLSHNQLKCLPVKQGLSSSASTTSLTNQEQRVSLVDKVNNIKFKNNSGNSELTSQQLMTRSYIEKPLVKVNFWQIHCLNQNDLIDDSDDNAVESELAKQTSTNQNQYQLNLVELNLSNNQFTKVPSCLSCLTPKLVKLNLSFNSLENMGSISDYPLTLKFLDLSNNQITQTIRLINIEMISYFVNDEKTTEFCYLNLIRGGRPLSSSTVVMNIMERRNPRLQPQATQQQKQHKRRSRSHSRNANASRLIHSNAINNRNPFELFLMNITSEANIKNLNLFDEDNYLNSHNLQCFLDKLCPHKRHIKLENLKTLNLNHNKIVNLKLTFNLVISSNENLLHLNKESSAIVESDTKHSTRYTSSSDENDDLAVTKQQRVAPIIKQSQQQRKQSLLTNQQHQLPLVEPQRMTTDKIIKILFPNLTHLDVSHNLVKHLSGNLSLLDHLSYLNVSNNLSLRKVSPKIGLLTKLWNFDLKNCMNITDQMLNAMINKQISKTSDVLGFLKSILEHSKPYTRIKLMFVGIQAIGKTSLLNKLREETTGSTQRTRSNSTSSWNDRLSSSSSSSNISTVGIDINEWVYEKPKSRVSQGSSSNTFLQNQQYINQNTIKPFGPVTFRTWDFAGQREYYATHQYFISKRALYLVCWKLTEQEKGINEINSWLINIQTRAPGSPVIIIGTHHDQLVKLKNYKEISNYLQRLIYERFIKPSEVNENCAYPPIWASIEVSCKTGHNIKQLANLIYDVACQMRAPGFKDQILFDQKIPVTYLALEDCLIHILRKFRSQVRNPVLTTDEYLKEVKSALEILYPVTPLMQQAVRFRDDDEILQATQFLHENGILIHYNDSALNDLFFLDPQWLCDLLATVVTIREINPFASKGIMLISNLLILFKGSKLDANDITGFVVDLLGKFELALTWDNKHLLIPSLLPTEAMLKFINQDIRIKILSKSDYEESQVPFDRRLMLLNDEINNLKKSKSDENMLAVKKEINSDGIVQSISMHVYLNEAVSSQFKQASSASPLLYECKPSNNEPTNSIRRLYLLSFIPTGFFSRLITRILSDNILKECLLDLLKLEFCFDRANITHENLDEFLNPLLDYVCKDAEWRCWQTGIELKYLDYTLIRVKEVLFDPLEMFTNQQNDIFVQNSLLYRDCENELKLRGCKQQSSLIECYASFKNYEVNQLKANNEVEKCLIRIFSSKRVLIKLFALIIEIIDSLLEDWYPDLGTRFIQDSKGEYLVTRLAPCNECLRVAKIKHRQHKTDLNVELDNQANFSGLSLRNQQEQGGTNQWNLVDIDEKFKIATLSEDTVSLMDSQLIENTIEQQIDYVADSTDEKLTQKLKEFATVEWIYCFMIDDICYSVLKDAPLMCVKHRLQKASIIAPDIAFEDIEKELLIAQNMLKFEKLLGRGSFGSVYSGILQSKFNKYERLRVAIKALENVDTSSSSQTKAADMGENVDYWIHRKPIQLASKAYTIARQEVAVLFNLKHENIVSIIGLSLKPLAIILELAPLGNLTETLADYKRNLCYLSFNVIQQLSVQISSALVYLHSNLIIYRDLKSENVLVWKFPKPNRTDPTNTSVLVKLADYSISRSVLPTGTKGFAGTEGYMSPEIIKYNGEETYSEKVDCFSFGMLLYELISLKHPFEGQEQIKEILLSGGRPLIKTHETLYPTLMLDLMCLCWSEKPVDRPSAVDILKYSKSHEFSHLLDVTVLEEYQAAPLIVSYMKHEYIYDSINDEEEQVDLMDIWVVKNCIDDDESKIEILTYENTHNCTSRKQINICSERLDAICLYKNQIWCIDAMKCIYVFCSKTYNKLNQYIITIPMKSEIVKMIGLENTDKIVICTKNGTIAVIHALYGTINDELNFNLFETNIFLQSVFAVPLKNEKSYELWLGSDSAQFHVFSMNTMKLHGIYSHYLNNAQNPMNDLVTIVNATATDGLFLWSYIYPSSRIFLWNHVAKAVMTSYDCKHLSRDFNLLAKAESYQMTAMNFMHNYLYCAATNGAICVFKRLTLTPLFTFNAHVNRLYALCPIIFEQINNNNDTPLSNDLYQFKSLSSRIDSLVSLTQKPLPTMNSTKHHCLLLTIGRGLSPFHEDVYLSSALYRLEALKNYANCVICCTWDCND